MANEKILVVEDREGTLRMLEETLSDEGYTPFGAATGEKAIGLLGKTNFDMVLTDLNLPGLDGMEVLAASRESDPFMPVVVMTAYASVENAVKAMKMGAYDFMTKPVDTDHLILIVKRALERRALEVRNRVLSASIEQPVIVGKSHAMQKVLRLAEKVSLSDAAVLLLGESGTGKELFARAIHFRSRRAGQALVAVNCAAIPHELIEAELFGAEKGAFTGATKRRVGRFELAAGGTLFLDEIGDLHPDLQSKLLRVLEERVMERVGSSRSVPVDVRLITATNRSLEKEMAAGRFREDLYYRLNVFPIQLPPLRERKEDLPTLARYFLRRFEVEMGRETMKIAPEAMQVLQDYEWPGNVRELRNVLERAVILAEGDTISTELIIPQSHPRGYDALCGGAPGEPAGSDLHTAVRSVTRRVETEMIRQVLEECGGNKSEAARRMSISYRSLWSKVKEYGLA